jgi:hypothetical protein
MPRRACATPSERTDESRSLGGATGRRVCRVFFVLQVFFFCSLIRCFLQKDDSKREASTWRVDQLYPEGTESFDLFFFVLIVKKGFGLH